MHGQRNNRPLASQRDSALHEPTGHESLTLATRRELHAPLVALRALLEGRRGSETAVTERAFVDRAFIDRALDELLRTEQAAANLVHWTCPRDIRKVPCTVAEIVGSLSSTLDKAERERCHFVIENGDADVTTDGPLLVDAFTRTIREALSRAADDASEVMIHAHADSDRVTISLVDGPADDSTTGNGHSGDTSPDRRPTLAEALLERDTERLGGRVSIHHTSEHRCCIAVFPRPACVTTTSTLAYGGAA